MQRPTRALAVIAVGLGAILGAADGVRAAAPWSDPQAVPGGFPAAWSSSASTAPATDA